jgi:hypothetical protein
MADLPMRRGPGRPKKIVDTGRIVDCAMLGLSASEIAHEIGISTTQLERIKKRDKTLREAIRIGQTGSRFEILAALRDEALNKRTIGAVRELMRRLELAD